MTKEKEFEGSQHLENIIFEEMEMLINFYHSIYFLNYNSASHKIAQILYVN
jgi:hypothetical protein